jgi:hypothetical protein
MLVNLCTTFKIHLHVIVNMQFFLWLVNCIRLIILRDLFSFPRTEYREE